MTALKEYLLHTFKRHADAPTHQQKCHDLAVHTGLEPAFVKAVFPDYPEQKRVIDGFHRGYKSDLSMRRLLGGVIAGLTTALGVAYLVEHRAASAVPLVAAAGVAGYVYMTRRNEAHLAEAFKSSVGKFAALKTGTEDAMRACEDAGGVEACIAAVGRMTGFTTQEIRAYAEDYLENAMRTVDIGITERYPVIGNN